jgi:hypothetical protein
MDNPSDLPTPFSEFFVSRTDYADLKKIWALSQR